MALTFGLALMNDFPSDHVPAERFPLMREQARAASESGFSSVWALQHYLGSMPTLQPVLTLAALAEDAGDMLLGTNMYILPLRHPVGAAEEFATLDHITNGRAVAGFGMGYRENEFKAFGVGLDERVARYEESVSIIRSLWRGETVNFEGKYFNIENERISLQPVQPGGPPIWVGAGPHPAGARRAARLGDAWIVPPHVEPEKLSVLREQYEAERAEHGLDRGALVIRRELVLDRDRNKAREIGLQARGDVTAQYAKYNAPQQGAAYRHLDSKDSAAEVADISYIFTDPEGAIEALKGLEAQGFTNIILRMQWYGLGQDQVLKTMELFRDEVLPAFK